MTITTRRLNQMDRADLIEYIRELEGEIQGYEDAEEAMMLEKDWAEAQTDWEDGFWRDQDEAY